MKRALNAVQAAILALTMAACSHAPTARPSVAEAVERGNGAGPVRSFRVPDATVKYLVGFSGNLSTGMANTSSLDPDDYRNREMDFVLQDGTRVGGLYFEKGANYPLLICTFGFIADRWSRPSAQFLRRLVEPGLIEANVLILDHPTSAPFLVNNGTLSLGGFDEGNMLLEVAETMKIRLANPALHIHLLGISMGGNGVVQALARRDRQLFTSAITFSAVPQLNVIPGWQLSEYPSEPGTENPWKSKLGPLEAGKLQKMGLNLLLRHFQDIYERMKGEKLDLPESKIALFFYRNFMARIKQLKMTSGTKGAPGEGGADLADVIADVRAPLVMIHAEDDPSVPFVLFERFVASARSNPALIAVPLKHGGHWGFTETYGDEWTAETINRAMKLRATGP